MSELEKQAKTVRIYRQFNNHYWIEEEDLARLVPALEPDNSQELSLVSLDVAQKGKHEAIEKAIEENSKAIYADWNRAGRQWREEEQKLNSQIASLCLDFEALADLAVSEVESRDKQIDLFDTLAGELYEIIEQKNVELKQTKQDLKKLNEHDDWLSEKNKKLKEQNGEANACLGAISKILDDVRKSLYFYVNPCATENKSAEEVAQDYMIKHTVKGEEKNYLEQGYLTHKIELELERLWVLTVNEGGKATLSQEQEEGEIMSLFDALREKQSKIVFKGLRCSDGLPCTAYTCTQNWCKFPERKADAKRCLADESKKDASQAVTEAKV